MHVSCNEFFVILVVRRGILTFMFALLATAPRSLLFPYYVHHFFIEFGHSAHWTTKTSVLFPLLSLLVDSRLWYLIPAATRAWAIETISMTWTMLHAKRRIEDIFHSLLKWFSQSLNLHIYFRRNKCAYPPPPHSSVIVDIRWSMMVTGLDRISNIRLLVAHRWKYDALLFILLFFLSI